MEDAAPSLAARGPVWDKVYLPAWLGDGPLDWIAYTTSPKGDRYTWTYVRMTVGALRLVSGAHAIWRAPCGMNDDLVKCRRLRPPRLGQARRPPAWGREWGTSGRRCRCRRTARTLRSCCGTSQPSRGRCIMAAQPPARMSRSMIVSPGSIRLQTVRGRAQVDGHAAAEFELVKLPARAASWGEQVCAPGQSRRGRHGTPQELAGLVSCALVHKSALAAHFLAAVRYKLRKGAVAET
mmetsp:Transcript_55790/g.172941  ORF Transcript_55790/g.172941 Transcript_55790/m.172941 type:complete len:237 (+) Transcript_55790:189-899(+)